MHDQHSENERLLKLKAELAAEQADQALEFTDRYGGPENWPDPGTVCKGHCEGLGVYPKKVRDTGSVDDDYEFVTCEQCGGTGKRPAHIDGRADGNDS